jgi:hypothetical protein
LKTDLREVGVKIDSIKNDIFVLKTKAAVIGALAGALTFALAKALDFLARK